MTLDKLMIHTNAILTVRAERKCPAIDIYIPILHEGMIEIANRFKVLSLITVSQDARVLRALGPNDAGVKEYIRFPKSPRVGTDKIDMDEELMYALSNFVAAATASENKHIALYKKAYNRIVKDYDFKLYNTPGEA